MFHIHAWHVLALSQWLVEERILRHWYSQSNERYAVCLSWPMFVFCAKLLRDTKICYVWNQHTEENINRFNCSKRWKHEKYRSMLFVPCFTKDIQGLIKVATKLANDHKVYSFAEIRHNMLIFTHQLKLRNLPTSALVWRKLSVYSDYYKQYWSGRYPMASTYVAY